MLVCVAFSLLIWGVSSQSVSILPPNLVGIEGNNLNVTCSLDGGSRPIFELTVNGVLIQNTGKLQGTAGTPTGTRFVYGPLNRRDLGLEFVCNDGGGITAAATLVVYCKS